jgi:hypothetical protein
MTVLTRLIDEARKAIAIEQAQAAERRLTAIQKQPLLQWYEQAAINELHSWVAAGVLPLSEGGLELMATAIELEHAV